MKKQYRLKVGLFVTVSFFVLAAAVLWLAGSRFLRPVDTYYIVFEGSVTGLLAGARVEYQGVTVGKVTSLRLTREAPPRPLVTVDLNPGTPIRQDTTASLIGSLVTNIRYVQLEGGSPSSPVLAEYGTIKSKDAGIAELQDKAGEIADRLQKTVESIQRDVLNKENLAALSTAIQDLSRVAAGARTLMDGVATPQTKAAITGLITDVSQAAQGIRRTTDTIDGMRDDAKVTLSELRQAATTADKLVKDLAVLTREATFMLAQNQSELRRLLVNMADAASLLREASAVVRDDPSRLIWGSKLPPRKVPDR